MHCPTNKPGLEISSTGLICIQAPISPNGDAYVKGRTLKHLHAYGQMSCPYAVITSFSARASWHAVLPPHFQWGARPAGGAWP